MSKHPDIVIRQGEGRIFEDQTRDLLPCHQGSLVSLYIHIPFCRHLCPYCAFYKQENPAADTVDSLVEALIAEILWYAPQQLTLRSIFWGGGNLGER